MKEFYNRYSGFNENGEVSVKIPFITIRKSESDIILNYDRTKMRLDSLSYKYYGDGNYAWLILQANPQYGGYEFSIPQGVKLRIPYPLDSALMRYESEISRWKQSKRE